MAPCAEFCCKRRRVRTACCVGRDFAFSAGVGTLCVDLYPNGRFSCVSCSIWVLYFTKSTSHVAKLDIWMCEPLRNYVGFGLLLVSAYMQICMRRWKATGIRHQTDSSAACVFLYLKGSFSFAASRSFCHPVELKPSRPMLYSPNMMRSFQSSYEEV